MGKLYQQGQSIRAELSKEEQKLIESAQAKDRESITGTPFNHLTCEENAYLKIAVQRTLNYFKGHKIPESLRKYADKFQLSYDSTASNYRPTPTAEERPDLVKVPGQASEERPDLVKVSGQASKERPDLVKVPGQASEELVELRTYHCSKDKEFAESEVYLTKCMFNRKNAAETYFLQPFLTRDDDWAQRIRLGGSKDDYKKLFYHGEEKDPRKETLKQLDETVKSDCYDIGALEYMAMVCPNEKMSGYLEKEAGERLKNSQPIAKMSTLLSTMSKISNHQGMTQEDVDVYNKYVPSKYTLAVKPVPEKRETCKTCKPDDVDLSEAFNNFFSVTETMHKTPFWDWDIFCAQLPKNSIFRNCNVAAAACLCIAVEKGIPIIDSNGSCPAKFSQQQANYLRAMVAKTYIEWALMDPKTKEVGTSVQKRTGNVKQLKDVLTDGVSKREFHNKLSISVISAAQHAINTIKSQEMSMKK